jgi:hypothetical protein
LLQARLAGQMPVEAVRVVLVEAGELRELAFFDEQSMIGQV